MLSALLSGAEVDRVSDAGQLHWVMPRALALQGQCCWQFSAATLIYKRRDGSSEIVATACLGS